MIKSMKKGSFNSIKNSTDIRKKGRPGLNIKQDILKILKNSKIPLSTSELSYNLNKAWHTIDRACLMLQIEEKVEGFKAGRMNLWRIK